MDTTPLPMSPLDDDDERVERSDVISQYISSMTESLNDPNGEAHVLRARAALWTHALRRRSYGTLCRPSDHSAKIPTNTVSLSIISRQVTNSCSHAAT